MKTTMCASFAPHDSLAAQAECPPSLDTPGRRALLKGGAACALVLGGGLLNVGRARAAEGFSFNDSSIDVTLTALGALPASGTQIGLDIPDVSEDGALVPVSISCDFGGALDIAIVVEKNPEPLAAVFSIPEGTQASFSTRVKVAESGRIYAVVRSGGRFYSAFKQANVMVGGCG